MLAYTVRRLLQAVVVVLGVVTIIFVLLHLLPGNQARAVLGLRSTPLQWAQYDHANGLDQPLPVQYLAFLGNIVQGRVAFVPAGYQNSVTLDGIPTFVDVRSLATGPLLNSLLLVGCAYVIILGCGLPLGVYCGLRPRRLPARLLGLLSMVLYASPAFFIGIVLTVLLTSDLRVLSANTPEWVTGNVLAEPTGLVLPVLTLALGHTAVYSRYLRSSVIGTLTMDYIATARAKGIEDRDLVLRHVLRNSLLPVITLLGTSLPAMFGIDAIVEYLFQYPGIGLTLLNAAVERDVYTMLGIVLIAGVLTVIASFLADVAYAALDPRIRLAGR